MAASTSTTRGRSPWTRRRRYGSRTSPRFIRWRGSSTPPPTTATVTGCCCWWQGCLPVLQRPLATRSHRGARVVPDDPRGPAAEPARIPSGLRSRARPAAPVRRLQSVDLTAPPQRDVGADALRLSHLASALADGPAPARAPGPKHDLRPRRRRGAGVRWLRRRDVLQ